MMALPLSELPEIVAAKIKLALPDLATCKGIIGRLDLDEVKRLQYPTPAVLISRLRLDQVPGYAGPHRAYRVVVAAFVLTKDTIGLHRDVAATNIAQVILQLLPDCRFGREDIGPAERIAEEPIVTPAIRTSGIALTAITWEQDVVLEELPAASNITPRIYVGGEEIGGDA
jgi:hypothetical protein